MVVKTQLRLSFRHFSLSLLLSSWPNPLSSRRDDFQVSSKLPPKSPPSPRRHPSICSFFFQKTDRGIHSPGSRDACCLFITSRFLRSLPEATAPFTKSTPGQQLRDSAVVLTLAWLRAMCKVCSLVSQPREAYQDQSQYQMVVIFQTFMM